MSNVQASQSMKTFSIAKETLIFPPETVWNEFHPVYLSLHYWWDFWRSKVSLQATISSKCGKRFLCILFLCCDFLVFPARVWQSLFATHEISCVAQALIFSRGAPNLQRSFCFFVKMAQTHHMWRKKRLKWLDLDHCL
jgi:hypothetical protein